MNQRSVTCLGVLAECTSSQGATLSQPYPCRSHVLLVRSYGPLPWAGVAGVERILVDIRGGNKMGHALLENIRAGPWLMEYLLARLTLVPELRAAQSWLWQHFEAVRIIPPNLRPVAFDRVIAAAYTVAVEVAVAHLSPFVRDGGKFVRLLGMTSVQLFSATSSGPLLDLPLIETPHARAHSLAREPPVVLVPYQPSLAAGLPHFSTGFMRNWGRDTFISLRGLLLVTGRFDEVRGACCGTCEIVALA